MIGKSCKERMIGKRSQLSNKERRLADYILAHYEEVLQCNVAELAELADVSDATVVRFCRSVGYKGYTDFKVNAARDIVPKEKQFYPILEQGDDTRTICRKIFTAEDHVLNRTLVNLDFDLISSVAEKIFRAKRIFLYGTGGSHIVALDAQHKFLKIGISPVVYSDIDLQLMSSTLLTEDDVAVCISFSGNNLHVINCMKRAGEKGAFRVGIISQGRSQLVKHVDAVIYSAYDETIFQSESISTRIAQLAILDCLVSCVAFQDYDRFNNAIGMTREATSESKY